MLNIRESCNNFFPTGYFFELKHLLRLAWPAILTQVLQFTMQPIATIFCGHLGKAELDAVGLANSLINVTGVSICDGLCTACDTLFSQTYGSKNRHKLGIVLQRSYLIVMLTIFPCWTIHVNTESLLILIGQDPEVSKLTAQYMLIFMPGLFVYFLYYPLVKYMQNQNIVLPNIALSVVPNVVSAVLHYILVIVYQYGTVGSAVAQAIGYSTFFPVTLLYIYLSKLYRETWHGFSWECLLHWGQFYRLALAGMFMICIEWWVFEIGTFMAGILGTTELGAQSIVMQTEVVCYMTGVGVGIAANIRIGHYLGGNNPIGAKSTYRTAITLICAINLVLGILLATLSGYIPMIFTNVEEVIEVAASLFPIIGLYLVFEGVTAVSNGILRGCGRQYIGAVLIFVAYVFMALPVGLCLMFLTPMRLTGLWWALAATMFINAWVYQFFLARTDWDAEAIKAWKRVFHKESISIGPDKSEFNEHLIEHNEKTALIEKDFSSSCHSEIRRVRSSSIVLSGRRSSLHPDPSIDTKKIEQSFVEDEFSDIPLKQLIFRRLILLFVMLGIFAIGLMFRLFLPASNTTMLDVNSDYNLTTAVTTQL